MVIGMGSIRYIDSMTGSRRVEIAAEIAAAVFRTYTEGPAVLASRHKFPRTSLTNTAESSGLRLKLSTPLPYSKKEEEKTTWALQA